MAPIDWSWGQSVSLAPALVTTAQHPPSLSFAHHMDIAPKSIVGLPSKTSLHEGRAKLSSFLPDVVWSVSGKAIMGNTPERLPPVAAGRKRSRDQISDPDGDDSSRSTTAPHNSALPTPSPPKSERMMEPDTYMEDPDAMVVQDASRQTGTWAEELVERLRSSSVADGVNAHPSTFSSGRPGLGESRKSIRLDRTDVDEPEEPRRPGTNVHVDEAALALGVGWSAIPTNPTMDAACRGWARHIEMNFPVGSAKVVWQNKALPAYLVSAVTSETDKNHAPWLSRRGSPGFFLFDDNLQQGRLVAKSWERTLDNLRSTPIVFDGEEIMNARPRAIPQQQPGVPTRSNGSVDVDMDMEI